MSRSLPILSNELKFPPVHKANRQGIVAVGGDLRIERLLLAYRSGIFPWYSEGQPIIWHSPDPRFVLFPADLKVSSSLKRTIRSGRFRVTFDTDFRSVIINCSTAMRPDQDGTWITREMLEAYCALHDAGYAHSVETWKDDKLAGGLYGVTVGKCFCGESMFTLVPDASKVAFVALVKHLSSMNFTVIDCQVYTEHLERFGASFVSRNDFITFLRETPDQKSISGKWKSPVA